MTGYTKGPVEVVEEIGCGFVVHPIDDPDSIICTEIGLFSNKGQADAALIAEAFNVAHETGRTPRQLADERAELLRIAKTLLDHRKKYGESEMRGIDDLLKRVDEKGISAHQHASADGADEE